MTQQEWEKYLAEFPKAVGSDKEILRLVEVVHRKFDISHRKFTMMYSTNPNIEYLDDAQIETCYILLIESIVRDKISDVFTVNCTGEGIEERVDEMIRYFHSAPPIIGPKKTIETAYKGASDMKTGTEWLILESIQELIMYGCLFKDIPMDLIKAQCNSSIENINLFI